MDVNANPTRPPREEPPVSQLRPAGLTRGSATMPWAGRDGDPSIRAEVAEATPRCGLISTVEACAVLGIGRRSLYSLRRRGLVRGSQRWASGPWSWRAEDVWRLVDRPELMT